MAVLRFIQPTHRDAKFGQTVSGWGWYSPLLGYDGLKVKAICTLKIPVRHYLERLAIQVGTLQKWWSWLVVEHDCCCVYVYYLITKVICRFPDHPDLHSFFHRGTTTINSGIPACILSLLFSMTSSSSSSPEISAAGGTDLRDRFSYKDATHDEVLEDLSRYSHASIARSNPQSHM